MTQATTLSTPGWGQEIRATLALAVPLAATNLLQMLIHAVDVIFIARLGDTPLAASSLGIAIFGLTVWAMTGLVGACAPLISAERGRRLHSVRDIRRTVRMGMWVSVLFGLVGMGIAFAGEPLLLLSGQEPAIAAMAGDFLFVIAFAMIPMILAGMFRIFVAALGKPGYATAITLLALGTNILGNYALVFGNLGMPALGLTGSALSSVITALAMLAAYVVVIGRDRSLRRYRIFGRLWRPEWTRLKEILVIGTPIALTVFAEAGLFSGAALLMGRIGQVELAAHTLALNLAALAFQVPFGVAQAATIRVGYHFGARDRAAAGRAGWSALVVTLLFMTTTASAMLFAPRFILELYVDTDAAANAAVPLIAQGVPIAEARERAKVLLDKLNIGKQADKLPRQLSGGQQQRVAIARALVHEPRLVVCDEPTAALDASSGRRVMDLLREVAVAPDRACIIVTHDNRIFDLADRIIVLEGGRVQDQGSHAELVARPGRYRELFELQAAGYRDP